MSATAKTCDLAVSDILLGNGRNRVLNSDGTTSSAAGAIAHERTIPEKKQEHQSAGSYGSREATTATKESCAYLSTIRLEVWVARIAAPSRALFSMKIVFLTSITSSRVSLYHRQTVHLKFLEMRIRLDTLSAL